MRLARKGNAMARSLTFFSALVLLTLPALAMAIGLGNVETRSALNQPLDARIPVQSASSDELESLRVQLASSEAFDRVGLERPFLLSRLRFEVEVHDGQPYIVIRTENPVREPFLAFLVEARWSGGRLLREYTVLLDPPLHAPSGAPQPTADAPAAAPDRTTAEPARTPSQEVTPTERGREYGPVQRNETAWDVASATRPDDSISVQQMMMALLRANPEAFGDGNVNNLRAGAVLRVPERAEIESMSAADARREFARQVEQWEAGRTPRVAEPEEPAAEAPAEEEVAEAPPEGDEVLAEDDEGRLQVVAPADTGGEDAGASLVDGELEASPETIAQLQQELSLTREEAAGLRAENEELREMASEMRQRVEALERMLDLNLDPGVTPPAEEGVADSAPEAADPAAADAPAGAAEDAAGVAEAGEEVAAAPAPAQPADDQFQAAPPAPWEDPRLLGLGAAVLLALLALLLMIRRRRQAAADQAELEAGDMPVADMPQAAVAPAAGAAAAAAGGMGAAAVVGGAGDEVADEDPLVQAESYMGYGRYDQAREVLEKGLVADPDNAALRLKLLEVHAINEDRPAFEAEAQALYGQVDGSTDPNWQRAVEMGRQVAPESPLFAADGPAPEEAMLDAEFDLDDTDAATDEKDVMLRADADAPAADTDLQDLEFVGLDDEATSKEQSGEPETPVDPIPEDDLADLESALSDPGHGDEDDLSDLEFALGDTQDETGTGGSEDAPVADEPAASAAEADDLSLDFDLDSEFKPRAPAPDVEQAVEAPDADGSGLDLEFRNGEPEVPSTETGSQDSSAAPLDTATAAGADDFDADDALFADADENSTKLDLARAYLEMGDNDGARSLLEEVLEEGTSGQKQEAETLLEQT